MLSFCRHLWDTAAVAPLCHLQADKEREGVSGRPAAGTSSSGRAARVDAPAPSAEQASAPAPAEADEKVLGTHIALG